MKNQIPVTQPNFDDIFDLWLASWWESPWVWGALIAGSIAFMGIIWFLFRYYKQYKKQQRPIDKALKRIAVLKKVIVKESGHSISLQHEKDLYVELFDIVKQYLDAQYDVQTRSKTERELYHFLITIDNYQIPEIKEWISIVALLLDRGMNIKYAQGYVDRSVILNECEIVHTILIACSQRQNKA